MPFPFGQDINYTFFPLIGQENAINIPSDSPSIYYFTDSNQPSRDMAQNGTNAVNSGAAITTWTEIPNQHGYWFTIPAIADPDPDSTIDRRTYWLGINFKLKTGGAFQTVIRALELERVTGHHSQFLVQAIDVVQFFPQVESYYTPTQINAMFWVVKEEIISYLSNKGFEWALVWDAKRLQTAAIFKLLMRLMEGQRKIPGDNWDKNHDEYKSTYKTLIDSLKLSYDAVRSNQPTEVKKAGGFAWVMGG